MQSQGGSIVLLSSAAARPIELTVTGAPSGAADIGAAVKSALG